MNLRDRQRAASEQGRAFETAAEVYFRIRKFRVIARKWRHPLVDVEIDLVLEHDDVGTVWAECTGSWESNRNGLERTDTMLKKIGAAAVLRSLQLEERQPYWLVTSHLPKIGSAPDTWLRCVGQLFDRVICLGEEPDPK